VVRFASLFGLRYDLDLLPHWLNHYRVFGFDKYDVWVDPAGVDEKTHLYAEGMFRRHGYSIHNIGGEFRDGCMRIRALQPLYDSISEKDFLVTADSDEFHTIVNDNREYRRIVESYDAVCGNLIDRWGDGMYDASPHHSLEKQYPKEGDLHALVRIAMGNKIDEMRRFGSAPDMFSQKIMACRGGLPLSLGGSHGFVWPRAENGMSIRAFNGEVTGIDTQDSDGLLPDMTWSAGFGKEKTGTCSAGPRMGAYEKLENGIRHYMGHKVLHYSWRKTVIERMSRKSYFTTAYIWHIAKLLGMTITEENMPDAFREKDRKELNTLTEKGWALSNKFVPAMGQAA